MLTTTVILVCIFGCDQTLVITYDNVVLPEVTVAVMVQYVQSSSESSYTKKNKTKHASCQTVSQVVNKPAVFLVVR